jgi:integrase
MALTELAIRNAPRRAKPYKLSDGQGLFLLIKPNGAKWWRFRYRFGLKHYAKRGKNTEKEKLLSCGVYPEVSLSEARKRRDRFRAQLRDRIDPGAELRAAKLATVSTLSIIAEEYLLSREKPAQNDKRSPLSAKTIGKQRYFIETFVLPSLGSVPISQITVPELFAVLKKLDDRGVYETRKKTQELCGKIWRYAVVSGRAPRDITPDLRGAFVAARSQPHAAITAPGRIGELLRGIDGYTGQQTTVLALKLSPYVFVRPSELRCAKKCEFDLARSEWRIPPERMKMRHTHIVPLAPQAVAILEEAFALNPHSAFVFPNVRTRHRPMSNNTINGAIRALGFGEEEMTGQGFRTMASTGLNELGVHPDVIELQLAHLERNNSRRPYNHATRLPDRRKMMLLWACILDRLRAGDVSGAHMEVTAALASPIPNPFAPATDLPDPNAKSAADDSQSDLAGIGASTGEIGEADMAEAA